MSANRDASLKLLSLSQAYTEQLTRRYVNGEISLQDWQIEMRAEIRRAHTLQLIAGHGGDRSQIADSDYLALGGVVKKQYTYLSQFGRDIQDGSIVGDAIVTRADMYAMSANESFWRAATKGEDLPAYPGDGTTICLTRCGCSWVKRDNAWHWVRGKSDSCDTCIEREGTWNPYLP